MPRPRELRDLESRCPQVVTPESSEGVIGGGGILHVNPVVPIGLGTLTDLEFYKRFTS